MFIASRHSNPRQRGLSLIELIMFIVIVSVGIAGVLSALNVTTKSSADPLVRKQALAIAEALLEEVQLARFTYCDPLDANALTAASPAGCSPTTAENFGPEADNARPFDNVNDYVNASGTALAYAGDVTGALLPNGYVASVTIQPEAALGPAASPIAPADATAANMNVLRITVRVTHNGAQAITLDGYRTRYAPNATP